MVKPGVNVKVTWILCFLCIRTSKACLMITVWACEECEIVLLHFIENTFHPLLDILYMQVLLKRPRSNGKLTFLL